MSDHFILFQSSRVHYSRWGKGDRLLFAFHGYGESAASFGFLEETLGTDFTIVAIDLPFHGETEWRDGFYFSPTALLELLESIAAGLYGSNRETGSTAGFKGGFSSTPHSQPGIHGPYPEGGGWWFLGYSMGGRVALQLLELAPQMIRRLVLLAPDGLQMNPWYWLATQTRLGNRLFRWTMKRPGWLFLLLRTGHMLGIVNPSIFKFTEHYIDNIPVRENLYARWTTMRGFRPHPNETGACIRREGIPVHLIFGSYDRIIRWERGERFRQQNADHCTLTLLPAGHQLLQPKFLEIIVKALNLPTI
jgi:pimeloyl-ACP methyl ester carboxylesterase